jgi:SAM-dependent methyltransferase
MTVPDRHLDLGCGEIPRNPYSRSNVCGVDVRPLATQGSFEYKVANLFLDPIPYDDNSFGSVSAYDFIEHVPRLLSTNDGLGTTFPFIRLMNEIWRVLAPGGRFYALTPAYPSAEAFTDPTHINIITEQTHTYFCGDLPLGRMYGFQGSFRAVDVRRVYRSDAYSAIAGSSENNSRVKSFSRKLRSFSRWLRGKQASLKPAYLLWELEAIKPAR